MNANDLPLTERSQLEDRFRLKTHREMRELQVYALVIAKGGPKLESVEAPPRQTPGPPAPPPPLPGSGGLMPASFRPPPGAVFGGPGAIIASAVPMTQLIHSLSSLLNRPVIDNTGLSGFFDFRLQFTPEEPVTRQPGINPGATLVSPTVVGDPAAQ